MFRIAIILFAVGQALIACPAAGIDLTTLDATATVQSVIFTQGDPRAPGTATYQPFVRIQAIGMEQGFNTDFRPLEPDAVGTTLVTHSVPMSSLQRVLLTSSQGSDYYFEFHLDANEATLSGASFLSIDQLRIYTATAPNIATLSTLSSTGTLRYDMDQPSDQVLLLDSALEVGSGSIDLTIHVPTWYLSGASATDYVYLFFHAGGAGLVGARDYGSSGGFEEMLTLLLSPTSAEVEAAISQTPWIRVIGGRGEGGARFRCSVPAAGRATISVHDVQGRIVARYERETGGPAIFEAPLNALGTPKRSASGIYFYRFEWNGALSSTGRVILLR